MSGGSSLYEAHRDCHPGGPRKDWTHPAIVASVCSSSTFTRFSQIRFKNLESRRMASTAFLAFVFLAGAAITGQVDEKFKAPIESAKADSVPAQGSRPLSPDQ